MDYRRLKGAKIDVLLNWSELRKAASTKTPVWVETIRGNSIAKEGWAVIPVVSGPSINLGPFSIQKPKRFSKFEFITSMEIGRAYVSVFQAFLKTKVILRTITSSLGELDRIKGTQVGDLVALFVEEPVDPIGERCLSMSYRPKEFSKAEFASADVWKILEHSVGADQDDETKILNSIAIDFRERTFEPIRFYVPAHKKMRKKRAPLVWMEWEKYHKND